MLGKPMRAVIGGGKAVIGSNVKVAALLSTCRLGTRMILGHSRISIRSQFQSPMRLDPAIFVVMAIADGGRLRNRCRTEPIR
jgi:hypothetical protein